MRATKICPGIHTDHEGGMTIADTVIRHAVIPACDAEILPLTHAKAK